MGEMTITLDCDVLNADGGTRCAAITGAWVALSLAFRHLQKMNVLKTLAADRPGGRRVVRHRRRRAGARPGLCRGFRRRCGRQFRADRRRRHWWKSRPPRRARRSPRRSSCRCLAWRARGRRELFARAARGRGRLMARPSGARRAAGAGQPQPRQAARDRGSAAAVRHRGGLGWRARSAGTRGERAGLRRQCADQGAGGGDRERAAGAVRRFRLLRRGAGWRAGRAFGALGRTGEGFCGGDGAGARSDGRRGGSAAPGSSPRCASPGRTATPRPLSAGWTAP